MTLVDCPKKHQTKNPNPRALSNAAPDPNQALNIPKIGVALTT